MFPFIKVTEQFKIPLYSVLFMTGYAVAILMARKIAGWYRYRKEDATYAAFYAAIGLLVGAKAVFFFTKFPAIVTRWDAFADVLMKRPLMALSFAFGGFVFYGGLIGGLMGVWAYCRQYKVPVSPLLDVYAPLIPFIHGFGRVGCFLAGCCYGIEYHGPFHVQFPYNPALPELSAVPRVPVQLIEAGLNFAVFAILLFLAKKQMLRTGQLLGIYLLYYTVARFFLEMLRGDRVRGNLGIFSTSQLISLFLFPVAVYLLSGRLQKKKKEHLTEKAR